MSATDIGAVLHHGLARLRRLQHNETTKVERKTLADIKRREAEHAASWTAFLLGSLLLSLVSAYVAAKRASLRGIYPTAYAWWNDVYLSSAYERPAGNWPRVTVPSMALRVEFPTNYWVENLLMRADSMPRAGAEFLLIMLTHYSANMHPIHFNGGAQQLRYTDLQRFLPMDQGRDWTYIWTSFNATNASGAHVNPWAGVLFGSVQALAASPAVQAYYSDAPQRKYLDALYHGGLVEVAMSLGTSATSGIDMVHFLIGATPSLTTLPCTTLDRLHHAVQTGATYGTLTLVVGTVFGLRFPAMGKIASHLIATGVACAAGVAQGAMTCKSSAGLSSVFAPLGQIVT